MSKHPLVEAMEENQTIIRQEYDFVCAASDKEFAKAKAAFEKAEEIHNTILEKAKAIFKHDMLDACKDIINHLGEK